MSAPARAGGSSPVIRYSSISHEDATRRASGKSAKICRPIFPKQLAPAHQQALEDAAYIFATAFAGPSENAICDNACRALGLSDPGVVRRILRKETKHPSFPLVMAAMGHIPRPADHPRLMRLVQWIMAS